MQKKFVLLFILVVVSNLASATIPDKNSTQRDLEATDIVTGQVQNVSYQDIADHGKDNPNYLTRYFVTDILIDKILKGYRGESWKIKISYWKPTKRPDGWVGPQGQNGHLNLNDHVKLWLKREENNIYRILEPNGIEWFAPNIEPVACF